MSVTEKRSAVKSQDLPLVDWRCNAHAVAHACTYDALSVPGLSLDPSYMRSSLIGLLGTQIAARANWYGACVIHICEIVSMTYMRYEKCKGTLTRRSGEVSEDIYTLAPAGKNMHLFMWIVGDVFRFYNHFVLVHGELVWAAAGDNMLLFM